MPFDIPFCKTDQLLWRRLHHFQHRMLQIMKKSRRMPSNQQEVPAFTLHDIAPVNKRLHNLRGARSRSSNLSQILALHPHFSDESHHSAKGTTHGICAQLRNAVLKEDSETASRQAHRCAKEIHPDKGAIVAKRASWDELKYVM